MATKRTAFKTANKNKEYCLKRFKKKKKDENDLRSI